MRAPEVQAFFHFLCIQRQQALFLLEERKGGFCLRKFFWRLQADKPRRLVWFLTTMRLRFNVCILCYHAGICYEK